MKIQLRFIGTGINDLYQARVKIYDTNHNLIKDATTYNGIIRFKALKNSVYLISVRFLNTKRIIPLYIKNKCTYEIILCNNYLNNSNPITFLLTDANYLDLPIMKGEIIYE